jgi:hypothetical protein
MLASPRTAFAQPKGGSAQVLTFEADEGAEDQADALSGALRARVRATPGWTLGDSTNSLSMMSAALKCASKTDGPCLQRIGDQLKTDKFFWGVVSKAPNKQLTTEVHLWQRGKPDSIARETFSEAVKDQNDETLKALATRIFDKLAGVAPPPAAAAGTMGAIAVHAGGDATGDLFIDNKRVGHVVNGEGRIDIKPGTYTIELRARTFKPAHQIVTVTAGAEASATLAMVPESSTVVPPPVEPEGGGSGRKILGWGLVGVGVVGGVVAVVEAVHWSSLQSKIDEDRKGKDGRGNYDVATVGVSDPCNHDTPAAKSACDTNKSAKSSSTVAWIAGGVGVAALGIGAVILLTDSSGSKNASVSTQGSLKPQILPYAGPKAGGVDLHWSF